MSVSIPAYLCALFLAWSCTHTYALDTRSKRYVILLHTVLALAVFSLFTATPLQYGLVLAWALLTAILDFWLIPYANARRASSLYIFNLIALYGLHIGIINSGILPLPRLPVMVADLSGSVTGTIALLLLAGPAGNHFVRTVVNAKTYQPSIATKQKRVKRRRKPTTSFQAQIAATSEIPLPSIANTDLRMGRVIGTLERLLIIVLVNANSYEALAFIIGAKSLVRYSRLSDEAFAEYYLVGTLTSTLVGVVLGLGIRALW